MAARLRSGGVDRRWGLVSKTGGLCVSGWSRSWAVARGREPGPAQPAKRAAGASGGMGWAPGDEVGVVGGGEGVDDFGGGEGLLAEGLGFAALCGVED